MYRLYRKMTIDFCLDITQLFNFHGFCFGPQQQCYKEVVMYIVCANTIIFSRNILQEK